MNGQIFPLFEHAHVLRTAMLAALRDYAYEYGQLIHEDYSDGIVSGCVLTTKETALKSSDPARTVSAPWLFRAAALGIPFRHHRRRWRHAGGRHRLVLVEKKLVGNRVAP